MKIDLGNQIKELKIQLAKANEEIKLKDNLIERYKKEVDDLNDLRKKLENSLKEVKDSADQTKNE